MTLWTGPEGMVQSTGLAITFVYRLRKRPILVPIRNCSRSVFGSLSVKPFKASSKEYSLSSNDFDIVNGYRKWLAEYFENEFNYEATLFMNLTKVKEFIANESSTLPKGATAFTYPREYDLVVRVDSITTVESNELAKKVLTGGK